jgi:hypothetical protein
LTGEIERLVKEAIDDHMKRYHGHML